MKMELKDKVTNELVNTQTWVARVLRDYPELRPVQMRRELIKKVIEMSEQDLYSDTITRMARHIQNTLGMYTVEDKRTELQEMYEDYFKGKDLGSKEYGKRKS